MYSSQHDGNALFSGGGFMPSQSTATITDSGLSTFKKRGNGGVIPLTVKQISQAVQNLSDDSSNIVVDGCEINNVTLVGMVLNKLEKVTDVQFVLDDGTGRIDVTRWNGCYVRVHGHLKTFQGKRLINSFCVRPITDFDELTFHYSECITVHVDNIKRQSGGAQMQPSSASLVFQNGSMGHQPVANQYSARASTIGSGSEQDINNRVQKIFEEPASLYVICHGCRADAGAANLNEAWVWKQ
ncbi:Replication protein A subunit A [Nymphaea thermarum]|nr:Replication protein A subunit A [Nymphaea thermarum]